MSHLNRRQFIATAAASSLLMWIPTFAQAASMIHTLEGEVFINKRLAHLGSQIKAGDNIVVAHGGKLIASIGGDAYLLHGGSALELGQVKEGLIASMRLMTGAVLAVFGKRKSTTYLTTSVATIGIRGTAVYLNSAPHQLYTCTCYGHTDIRVGTHIDEVKAMHHSAHEIFADSHGVMSMRATEVKGHDDDELRMLEALVGRKPLFDSE